VLGPHHHSSVRCQSYCCWCCSVTSGPQFTASLHCCRSTDDCCQIQDWSIPRIMNEMRFLLIVPCILWLTTNHGSHSALTGPRRQFSKRRHSATTQFGWSWNAALQVIFVVYYSLGDPKSSKLQILPVGLWICNFCDIVVWRLWTKIIHIGFLYWFLSRFCSQ